MPRRTKAGGTEEPKSATAQIARLRIRRLVPNGGAGRAPSLCVPVLTSAVEVAFRLEVGEGRVERLAQAAEQVGELGLVDDQRRADRDPGAHVANEQAALPPGVVDAGARAHRDPVARRPGLLVADPLARAPPVH